jgi:hypothetical protein
MTSLRQLPARGLLGALVPGLHRQEHRGGVGLVAAADQVEAVDGEERSARRVACRDLPQPRWCARVRSSVAPSGSCTLPMM